MKHGSDEDGYAKTPRRYILLIRWHRRVRATTPDLKTACGGPYRQETDRDNDTSAQPQTSQWGRLAEILGEVSKPMEPVKTNRPFQLTAKLREGVPNRSIDQFIITTEILISDTACRSDLCPGTSMWDQSHSFHENRS